MPKKAGYVSFKYFEKSLFMIYADFERPNNRTNFY